MGNESAVSDYSILEDADRQLNGPITTFTFAVGICLNFTAIFVFLKPRNGPRINQYLVALSLWDTSLLVGAFLMYSLPTLWYGSVPFYGDPTWHMKLYPFWFYYSTSNHVGSVWVIMSTREAM